MPKRAFASSSAEQVRAASGLPREEPEPAAPVPAPPSPVAAPLSSSATAAELTDETIVRARSEEPSSGWRRLLHVLTGGVVDPGIGTGEREQHELAARIRADLPGPHHVAVMSLKGGVGKTTVAAVLGLLLSEYRGDRVVAMDANPDAGTLAERLAGPTEMNVRDLLDHADGIRALPDLARFAGIAGRLQVLASEQDPAKSKGLTAADYERVCAVLTRYYDIVVTDSGTGVMHSTMNGTLALANSLVVVGSLTADAASRAGKTLDWLDAHGHRDLVERAVVVLCCDRSSKDVAAGPLRAHFSARCRAVVEIPHDEHLATGGLVELPALRPATSKAFVELAALVADEFPATQVRQLS
jgi:MinD-like ATPase involved in chromosome partitioning or flagellar assembly